jgi:16S rRNA (guanine527-N7)-methyltransferase
MPALTESAIAELIAPYLPHPPASLLPQLSVYLDLLLKWNARTNLTAIHGPEEIVRRHFGESLFAARHLDSDTPDPDTPDPDTPDPDTPDPGTLTLLDFGSGAGFPGLPIALLRPDIHVTLAESQNKKATFLREVVRTLAVSAEVWSSRVESMPAGRRFHTVALRAVDNMTAAIAAAAPRATHQLLLLAGSIPALPAGFSVKASVPIPNTTTSTLIRALRV